MGRVLGLAEVVGGAAEPGGHYVPARAAATDMVQGGKLARHLEGFGVADGHGRHQADVRRQRGQGRKDGQRFEAVEVMGAGFLMDMQAVGDEHEIELRAFRELCLLFVETEVDAGVGLGLWMAPFAPAMADAMDHRTEFQLAFAHVLTPFIGTAVYREAWVSGVRLALKLLSKPWDTSMCRVSSPSSW